MNMKMIKVLSFLVFEIVTCVLSVKADYVPSMRSMAPTSITALASATGNGTDSDEKFYEYTVTGRGILFIDYSIDYSAIALGGEGYVTCWIDGVEVFNFYDNLYSSSVKGTLQWPLFLDGEHTIKWKVYSFMRAGLEPIAEVSEYAYISEYAYWCSCSLDILITSLKSWADMGLVTKTDNGFTLQLTNDIAHTVYFTDDLGEVVLDLNGHSITGSKSLPGIAVVKEGSVGTHLKVVDSLQTGLSKVKGGDGYAQAGAGVEVFSDAAGVLISVGEKVEVKGGSCGYSGDGGAGIIGNIEENCGEIRGGNGGFGGLGGSLEGIKGSDGADGLDGTEDGPQGINGEDGEDGGVGGVGKNGGDGGIGVNGNVQNNKGVICGGNGGLGGNGGNGGMGGAGGKPWWSWSGGIDGDGGNGGNGGNGGDGGNGGNGGIGVYGNVGNNENIIYGGIGGASGEGGKGGDGGDGGHSTKPGDVNGGDSMWGYRGDEGMDGAGGFAGKGGAGVSGNIGINKGEIIGGAGGIGNTFYRDAYSGYAYSGYDYCGTDGAYLDYYGFYDVSDGGEGGSGIKGDVQENIGIIVGGKGGDIVTTVDDVNYDDIDAGRSGLGGIGVCGNVDINKGEIIGGDGGSDLSDYWFLSYHIVGGDGGIGVKGYVSENDGTIVGGKGGRAAYWEAGDGGSGGDGGIGVLGNIGFNKGKVIGGAGSGSVYWYGDGGIGVKGVVSNNTSGAFIIGGEGGWNYIFGVWHQGGYGGVAFEGNVITNNGTIAKGRNAGASVKVTCADCVYDGNQHSIEIEIYNLPEWFSLSRVTIGDEEVTLIDLGDGNYKATKTYIDAGSYSPVCIVGENEHWGYDDNNECEGFEIQPKNVYLASIAIDDCIYANCDLTPKPVITDVERGVALVEGQDYTLSYSNNKNAGVATVTVTGKGNYSGTVTRNFTIAKAEVVPPILAVKPYTGSAQAATVPANPLYRVVQNIPQTSPGTYSVMLELVDPANYRWKDSESAFYTVPFSIKSREQSELEDAFGGLSADIESDGKGGWLVTLADDLTGPVEISGKLGNVTIDLNGNDIVGIDGEPAIRIIEDDGDGTATHLSLVTTGGASLVQGGKGSPAIEVEDGTAGIVVDIGRGVTVRGGGDDVPAVSGGDIGECAGTVKKVQIPIPVISDLEFTGEIQMPQLPDSDLYTAVISSGSNPGSYPVMLTLADPDIYEWVPRTGVTVNGAIAIFAFTILDPPPGISTDGGLGGGTAGALNAASRSVTYDGKGHGIDVVVVNPDNALVKYALSPNGPFNAVKPLFTNAVDEVAVWFEISAPGFDSVTNWATVTVAPKQLAQTMVRGKALRENEDGKVIPVIGFADVPPCKLTQDDWEIVSWTPRASGGGVASVCGKGNYTGALTIDVPNEMTVVFDAVYGSTEDVRTVTTQIPGRPYALPPTDPVYRGHDFLGWYTERQGGVKVTSSCTVSLSDPVVVYAHWKVKTYRVSFDLNGGTGDAPSFDASYGSAFNGLPHVTKPGYLFDGWWSTSDFRDGTLVQDGDSHPTVDTTLYAKWLRRALWYSDAIFHLESAAVYNGYLVDEDAGDVVAGTITVKAGKPNKKTGFSKLSVSVSIAGERKISLKGETFDGTMKATAKDGRELDILLGESALTGRFGNYLIDGSRDIFSAKDEDSKLKAAQAMKEWQGVYMLAWEGDSGWNGLSLTINSKGKVKVSGALSNGTKVSATSLLLIGERESAIAVSWTKKDICVAFLVWLKEDGCIECSNLNGDGHVKIANSKSGAYLSEGSVFFCDPNEVLALVPEACTEILPDGQPVRMDGSSFDIDKAGKVKLLKDKSGLDLSKAGLNPSGLKLAYKIKDCTFKGSFTVYAIEKGRLKKHKVAVTGVVIDGVGYGTATIKKLGSWTVEIR